MPHRDAPVVSVCMPTYNRAGMLREAILSVLSQTFTDFEVIVADNASVDETETVVRSFDDSRIIYAKSECNIGATGNFNRAFGLARGEFVALCPDDDLMLPNNLSRKVEVLRRHLTVGLVHSRFHVVDQEGKLIRANTNQGHGAERDADVVEAGHVFLRRMLRGCCEVNPVSVVFRRECLDRFGGFDESLAADDYEYWMKLAVYYDVAYLAEPLVKWRVHSQTLTNRLVVKGKTGESADFVLDQLKAKHGIVSCYAGDIPDVQSLRRMLREQIEERTVFQADCMLDDGVLQAEVRRFLFKMAATFPCLLRMKAYWKTVAKVLLPRRGIEILKRLRGSTPHSGGA